MYRDDKEWLQHRQIMNNFILKDIKWAEQLIEMTCDNFTSKIKRIVNAEIATTIENIEDELYLWSIYCNLNTFEQCRMMKKKIQFNFTAIANLMLGSSTSEQSDRKFDAKVWEFVKVVKRIFETSSKLMSIPVNFADKINMKAYSDFEEAAHSTIAICKEKIRKFSNFFLFYFFFFL